MSRDEPGESLWPVSRALAAVGDRWTLLILCEFALGVHRFEEIQAQVGASPFLLSERLKRLERQGLIERRAYSTKPIRYEYFPTQKGKAVDPVILALLHWGLEWGGFDVQTEPAVRLVDQHRGRAIDFAQALPWAHMRFGDGHIDATLSEAYIAERAARRAAFFAGRRQPKKCVD